MTDWLSSVEAAAPVHPQTETGELMRGMNAYFRSRPKYWRQVGTMRSFRGQFCIEGGESFFLAVDEAGGRAQLGVAEKADVTWHSDLTGFKEALGGRVSREHPVKIQGRLDMLRTVLRSLITP